MAGRRVAVTGLSLITPLSCNVQTAFQGLCTGLSGIKRLDPTEVPDYEKLRVKVGGKPPSDFDVAYWNKESSHARNEVNSFSLAITANALKDGKWKVVSEELAERFGGAYGIERASMQCVNRAQKAISEVGYGKIERFVALKAIVHIATGSASINNRMRGPTNTIVMDSCSGAGAIGEVFHMLQGDEVDIGFAGAADGNTYPLFLASFDNAGILNHSSNDAPEKASKPFDQGSQGMVFSDGGGGLLLETFDHAEDRDAEVRAELVSFSRVTELGPWTEADPNGDGTYRAITLALKNANVRPEEVDLVSASGFGRPSFDRSEAIGIKRAFGRHSPSVTTISGNLGHLKAGSGAVQSVFAVLSLQSGLIPPILNLTNPIPETQDLDLVTGSARKKDVRYAVVINKGFGGFNTALLYKKAEA
jgi:3-oxoacyl-[acyl-carrier-protein] synthase II